MNTYKQLTVEATNPGRAAAPFVASNSAHYVSSMKHASVADKTAYIIATANACIQQGGELQALANYRVAQRLSDLDSRLQSKLEKLESSVARERPWARFLPPDFRVVFSDEQEYRDITDTGLFAEALLPFRTTALGQGFFAANAGGRITNVSFVLLKNSVPLIRVIATIHLDQGLSNNNAPLSIGKARNLNDHKLFHYVDIAFGVLEELCLRHGGSDIAVFDGETSCVETAVGRAAMLRSYMANLTTSVYVDLSQSTEAIWRNIRKSYHALIRRSAETITIRRFSDARSENEIIGWWQVLRSKTLHSVSIEMVQFCIEQARLGLADISAGFLANGSCCALTVILDDGTASLYFAGHYTNDAQHKKHSHLMIHDAILHAKKKGQQRFYLSLDDRLFLPYYRSVESIAEEAQWINNLRFFMRGFTHTVERNLAYQKKF